MPMPSRFLFAIACCVSAIAGMAWPRCVAAQTTDGYHAIQVFPVVVDSASFTQRFVFRNPGPQAALTVDASFFPGAGAAQSSAMACPPFVVPADSTREFSSLRELCPGLLAGSTFGFLYTSQSGGDSQPYAAFSRVSNAAGAGFSVEAFPAHTFTSADSVVAGIRRRAATGNAPAFQTNCFVGNLNLVSPVGSPAITQVAYSLYGSDGVQLGTTTAVDLAPGKLVRLLDVFSTAGAPPGDHDGARIVFEEFGPGEPGLMTFCTVQDNTSFGADFRIGKQELGLSTGLSSVGAQDDGVSRDSVAYEDVITSGQGGPRQFEIPAGDFSNTHVIYFRHPDRVQCELVDPYTVQRLDADDSLEMRLLDAQAQVIAGGNGVTGFGEIYLGDKSQRNDGANGRYTLEVESTGSGLSAPYPRAYAIHCQSGSGHSGADLLRFNEPVVRF